MMSIPEHLEEVLQIDNVWAAKCYAIAIGGVMGCFIIYHWCSKAYFRYGPRRPNQSVGRFLHVRRFVMILLFLNVETHTDIQ